MSSIEPSVATMSPSGRWFRGPWFWSWAVAIFVFPLIWVGGLVTTHDAGMAVPDWPGTYGYNLFLYPVTAWLYGPFDLFIEHGHRLLGSFVGLLCIALCVSAWRNESRPWYRWGCLGLLLAVICQGLLGGLRVVLDGRTIAMLHGCGGPMVFAFAVFMALAASKDWRTASATLTAPWLRRFAIVLLILTVAQLFLGAQLRHTLPNTEPSGFMAMVHLHLTGAGLLTVVILVVAVLVRCFPYSSQPKLLAPSNALLVLLLFQVFLGFGTWLVNYALPWSELSPWLANYVIQAKGYWESLIVTAHQATGSLLIALSVWLLCRVSRRQAQLVGNPQLFTMSRDERA